MKHTRTQANKLAESLRALPAAVAADGLFNKKAMVSYLRAEIIGLQERRYTRPAIAAALHAGGFEIALGTLKTYLHDLRVASRGHRRKGHRRAAAASRGLLAN